MTTINTPAEYKAAVFDICEQLYNKDSRAVSRCKELIATEQNVDFATPIGYISQTFSLTDNETVAICVCASLLWQYKPLPLLSELADICNLKLETVHHIFNTQQDGSVLSNTVRAFIMGTDSETPFCTKLHIPTEAKLFHSHKILDEMQSFCNGLSEYSDGFRAAVVLTGKKGVGKTFLLTRFAELNSGTLLEVDVSLTPPEYASEIAIAATLYRSIVCIKGIGTHPKQGERELVDALHKRLSLLFFVDEGSGIEPVSEAVILKREITGLTLLQRRTAVLELFNLPQDSATVESFYSLYNATIGNLVNAKLCYTAEVLVGATKVGDEEAVLKLIKNACAGNLGENASKTVTNKRLCDVVLPIAQAKKLEEISSFIKNKRTVYEQWNFNDKIPYGRGITMLFYGSSGTGKTLAASAMANELGLDLYRVDLSRLISKYIGETQKNIGKIFDDAEKCDCILFFDEADALFSKRTDNADSQDKHSNAEIAYLLQRTEHYDGAIILATNLLQNFDDAFRRRIDFMLHFPLPDERLREKMWENIFPVEAPTDDINCGLLAKHIELSGAGIRNCAVNSALLAASEGGNITMNRVIRAAQMEYQKQNKQLPVNLVAMFADE